MQISLIMVSNNKTQINKVIFFEIGIKNKKENFQNDKFFSSQIFVAVFSMHMYMLTNRPLVCLFCRRYIVSIHESPSANAHKKVINEILHDSMCVKKTLFYLLSFLLQNLFYQKHTYMWKDYSWEKISFFLTLFWRYKFCYITRWKIVFNVYS